MTQSNLHIIPLYLYDKVRGITYYLPIPRNLGRLPWVGLWRHGRTLANAIVRINSNFLTPGYPSPCKQNAPGLFISATSPTYRGQDVHMLCTEECSRPTLLLHASALLHFGRYLAALSTQFSIWPTSSGWARWGQAPGDILHTTHVHTFHTFVESSFAEPLPIMGAEQIVRALERGPYCQILGFSGLPETTSTAWRNGPVVRIASLRVRN